MFIVVITFGVKRWIEMVHFENAEVKDVSLADFYTSNFTFRDSDQLWFGISVVNASGNAIDIENYGYFDMIFAERDS